MTPAERCARFYSGKKVLVTGGAGMIGSHLVEMIVPMGAKVRVPVRSTTDTSWLDSVKGDIEIVQANLFDAAETRDAVDGMEAVIHLAAAKGGGIAHSMAHHGSLFRDNVLSFTHLLDAVRAAKTPRTLVVSSACVYPRDCSVPTPEEEGVKDAPEPTNAGYGWSKRMEEFMAHAYAEEFGLDIGIARPFNAYGPRDDFFREFSHVIPGLIQRFLTGDTKVWGTGQQTRSFLYVTDFARGVMEMAAAENVKGPLNIGPDEEVTIEQLANLIRELGGIEKPIEFDTTKPDGQPRRACDTRRAKKEIGFEAQVSLRDGLQRTIEWYQTEKARRNNS